LGPSEKEIWAKLLLSIGTRKRWRAADPISTAQLLETLSKTISQKEIAKKLGVTPETVREFLNLLTLSPTVQELVRMRKISIDAGYRLSLIKNWKHQEALAKATTERTLTTKEIRGIIQSLMKRNPDMPLSECIETAVKYRPTTETEDMVVTSLEKDTYNRLKAEAQNRATPIESLLGDIARRAIKDPKNLKTIKTIDNTILLILTKEGLSEFTAESKRLRTRPNDLMEYLTRQFLGVRSGN
jgi:transcriptional regulator with XRE-family HTH domain